MSAPLGRWKVQAGPVAVDPAEQVIDPRNPGAQLEQINHQIAVMRLNSLNDAARRIATTGKALLIAHDGAERIVHSVEEAAQVIGEVKPW